MFIVPVRRDSHILAQAARLSASTEAAPRSPALDLAESELAYTVKLEVPGVAKEDVKVTVAGRRVTVQAASEARQASEAGNMDPAHPAKRAGGESADRIVYRERLAPSYLRSFTLPLEVEQADTQARLDNGVLTLTLPKRNARPAARVTVN